MTTRQEWDEYLEYVHAFDWKARRATPPPKESAMSDAPKKTGLDRDLISLSEPHEVRNWTESIGVTEQQLRAAVAAVGNSAEKVREYLRKR
ncbi:DUF3606 domain-containing protein [Variovorax sp. M-6]|uniref:DUF3606 domain-containing protein n=1 Tax=Variovorax sp. M-6 TaxID=3233041 RepID=UPI003F96C979